MQLEVGRDLNNLEGENIWVLNSAVLQASHVISVVLPGL